MTPSTLNDHDEETTAASRPARYTVQAEIEGNKEYSEKESVTSDARLDAVRNINHIHGAKLALLLSALTLAVFLTSLNASIVAAAIPKTTDRFDSSKDVGWYGAAFLVTDCCLLTLGDKLYSFYPSKMVFVGLLALFELGSVICATAVSSSMFIAGRALAGGGAAGVFTGCFTIIAAAAPIERRPLLTGIAASISTTGQVVGPLIGGALTERVSWRWCFYINIPPGCAVIVLIALINIPDSANRQKTKPSFWTILVELDIFGFALFAPAIVLLLLAIELGGTNDPWDSATIIGLFCGSGGFMVVWLVWDYWHGDKAMVPMSLFRNYIVSFSCLTDMFQYGGLLVITYYLPIWFQVVKGDNPLMSGVSILPTMVSQTLAGLVTGWLVTKLGYYLPYGLIGSALTAVGAGLMSTFVPPTSIAEWVIYQILAGLGRGMVLQIPIIAVQTTLPPKSIPVGTGLVNFAQYFGATLLVALAETTLSSRLPAELKRYAPSIDPKTVLSVGVTEVRDVVEKGCG